MTPTLTIAQERPDTPDAIPLIDELERELSAHYAAASRHGFSVQKLIDQGVAFFVARLDGAPAGCGGILLVNEPAGGSSSAYGELKRMYVRPAQRGLGISKRIIEALAAHARAYGIALLRLETGIHQHAAIALYEHFGFQRIPPFGPYWDDPVSLCYELRIG